MDELITRVLRTVACYTRLRILSRLTGCKEMTLTQLARALRLRRDLVCIHLARLAAVGLVQRRRSGVRCYCIAGSSYSQRALSGRIASWLREALGATAQAGSESRLAGRGTGRDSGASREAHRVIFEAATAFTNPRRIRVLRRLAGNQPVEATALARELRMSGAAFSRHVAKLTRRGYVSSSRHGRRVVYRRTAHAKTPIHAGLLEIVSDCWEPADEQPWAVPQGSSDRAPRP